MKILFSEKFKALRTGLYIVAAAAVGEFIIDTDLPVDSKEIPTGGILKSILDANKIAFSQKATKTELLEAIEAGVEKLKLPTQNEKPESMVVAEFVKEAYESGEPVDEDELLMKIVTVGKVKFKNAGKLYKQAMIDGGYAVSNKDRKQAVHEILVAAEFSPNTWAEVRAMLDRLVAEVPATVESQAYSLIRAYAKEFDISLPKPEKTLTAGGVKAKILDFMYKSPLSTKEDFYSFVTEALDKDEKMADKYWSIFEVGQKIAAATIALQSAE